MYKYVIVTGISVYNCHKKYKYRSMPLWHIHIYKSESLTNKMKYVQICKYAIVTNKNKTLYKYMYVSMPFWQANEILWQA
jgi:hypothetical protein